MNSPAKRHGGKAYLAKWIISLMPAHARYTECCFGSGAVLFAKECEGIAEFINDIDGELMNFWSVLKDVELSKEFIRLANLTPFSQVEFQAAKTNSGDAVQRALNFFIVNRQSRQALGKDFATPTIRIRRGLNEQVSAWLSAVEGLPEACERLRRVEIWNCDLIKFIDKLDSYDSLHYIDVPYVHETRTATSAYQFEMSNGQHLKMLQYLNAGMRGKVMISGYPNGLYDTELTRERGWRTVDLEIDNKSSSSAIKEMKIERLWMNYER